jgi:cytochrome c oxidase cbb3-type subunit 4
VDINDVRALFTVLAFILFSGIVWWAYSDRRKLDFEEAARLPMDDDLPPGNQAASGELKQERNSS